MNLNETKVAVIGSGVMGSQIALQCAINGFSINLFSRNKNGRAKARNNVVNYLNMMLVDQKKSDFEISNILSKIKVTSEYEKGIKEADFIIESVTENFEIKKEVFKNICRYCKKDAIILTNTSSFIPSMFLEYIENTRRFCALHFYSPVWKTGVVDIMYHSDTDEQTKKNVIEFAKYLKQDPIVLKKEKSNYVFNSILNQVICKAIQLLADDVASIEDIDFLWKKILGTNIGPFGIMDAVGLDTVYNIINQNENIDIVEYKVDECKKILDNFIKNGDLGIKTGKGFYNYK